jgi:hypothetical protein
MDLAMLVWAECFWDVGGGFALPGSDISVAFCSELTMS